MRSNGPPSRLSSSLEYATWALLTVWSLACGTVLAQSGEALGTTEAVQSARLGLSVSGRIARISVKEGDRVSEGQLLVHLDKEAEELELSRRELLFNDQSQISALRDRQSITKRQVDAAHNLLKQGGLARKLVEDEVMALRAITAELDATLASKAREKLEVDIARQALRARHLRAPFSGVVTKIHLQLGESVPANEPVIVLVDARRVRFVGAFDPLQARAPKLGQTARVTLPTHKNLSAGIIFVSPVADPSSGLVEVIAEFPNPVSNPVRPGLGGALHWEAAE